MSDADVIAEIRTRQHMTISPYPDAPLADRRSALRVGDVDRLLEMAERQRRLLDECTTLIARMPTWSWRYVFVENNEVAHWHLQENIWEKALQNAVLGLLEEVRRERV